MAICPSVFPCHPGYRQERKSSRGDDENVLCQREHLDVSRLAEILPGVIVALYRSILFYLYFFFFNIQDIFIRAVGKGSDLTTINIYRSYFKDKTLGCKSTEMAL